jgi:hypothetical protein
MMGARPGKHGARPYFLRIWPGVITDDYPCYPGNGEVVKSARFSWKLWRSRFKGKSCVGIRELWNCILLNLIRHYFALVRAVSPTAVGNRHCVNDGRRISTTPMGYFILSAFKTSLTLTCRRLADSPPSPYKLYLLRVLADWVNSEGHVRLAHPVIVQQRTAATGQDDAAVCQNMGVLGNFQRSGDVLLD